MCLIDDFVRSTYILSTLDITIANYGHFSGGNFPLNFVIRSVWGVMKETCLGTCT